MDAVDETSSMTPIETLRAAATLMRERTELVPEGPWQSRLACVWSGWDEVVLLDGEDGTGGADTDKVAAYIASWHPVVALAVADWLDGEAVVLGETEPFVEMVNAVVTHGSGVETLLQLGRNADGSIAMHADTSQAALAVARAYLSGEEGVPQRPRD
jgi:hypothetical protein